MPDKEGSDDKKSTKSVVNKKQKQMLNQEYIPEEEYDHYKDRMAMAGREIRSKDTKDASSYPQSRKKVKGDTPVQKEFKKKYGKKATALDAVKADITAKYGKGAIMKVGKKKVKEELDLTKIAEALGGYIVEANGKNGKKNRNKKDSIDDFIDADDPFNVQARRDFEKDRSERGFTTGDDPRYKKQESEFDTEGRTRQPETNPLRKKGGRSKPNSIKFTQRPGEKPVISYKDPSQIDPKIAAREKAKRKESKRKPTAAELAKDRDEKLGAKSFKKDVGGEKIISPTMQDRLEKATAGPRRARKRRSDAASFAQVKADIDTADAARKAKGKGEYASDYEKRLAKAYDKSLEDTVKTGRAPAGQPLPQAKTKTPQGKPQKERELIDKIKSTYASDTSKYKIPDSLVQQATDRSMQDFDARELSSDGASPDEVRKFNQQQNQRRRLQRQGMADSGATPFKQPPLPDPKTGPSSKLTFSKFQQDQQKRFDQNKKDAEAADAYKQTPEYKLQTQQVDPNTGQLLSKDELKRRFKMQRQGNQQQIDKDTPKDQGKIDLDRDSLKSGIGGFERGRQGTLSRRGSDPRNEKSPNVETMPEKIGRKAKTMMDKTQTGQMSYLGALGGILTKGVSSSAAGAEAGMRYARGDKGGAALSALQGMGGSVGFAAGVANAIRSMRIAKGGKTAGLAKVVPPEDLATAAAVGGAVIPQVKGVYDRLKSRMGGGPLVQGGRVGRRSAPS